MDPVNKMFHKSILKIVLDKIFVIPLPVFYQFKKALINFQGKQIKLQGTFPTGTTHAYLKYTDGTNLHHSDVLTFGKDQISNQLNLRPILFHWQKSCLKLLHIIHFVYMPTILKQIKFVQS